MKTRRDVEKWLGMISALFVLGLVLAITLWAQPYLGGPAEQEAQTVSFIARRDFAAGSRPSSVGVSDFNGDGKLDLAVANSGPFSSKVSVLLGNGDGSFQAARNFAAGNFPSSVAVGDFNGDGVQNLAVANAGRPPLYLDETGIDRLVGAYQAAWAAHDAEAIAATYTVDGRDIDFGGGLLTTRLQIEGLYRFLFFPETGPFRNTTQTLALREVIWLSDRAALVELTSTIRGYDDLPLGLRETLPGEVSMAQRWHVVEVEGIPLIFASQSTPIPPQVPDE